jgi:hypothetical protein
MEPSGRYSIPRLYYLVTPAFIARDYWMGVNVRVAVLRCTRTSITASACWAASWRQRRNRTGPF